MTNQVSDILNQFNPITLEEMDGVKLMDRTDKIKKSYLFFVRPACLLSRQAERSLRRRPDRKTTRMQVRYW